MSSSQSYLHLLCQGAYPHEPPTLPYSLPNTAFIKPPTVKPEEMLNQTLLRTKYPMKKYTENR